MSSIKKSPGARTFGGDPAAYHAARPPYPPALFAWLKSACALGPETRCFEIGAGTGLATRPILDLGVRSIFAIEPDANLAAFLCDHAGPSVTAAICRFEDAALKPAAFDFGFAATSFHWVKRMKALEACLAALKPGGWLAIWWGVYHDPTHPDPFDAATAHLFEGLEQSPRMAQSVPFALHAKARTGEMRKAGFVNVEHRAFVERRTFNAAQIAALYGSFSRVQIAPEATRRRLLAEAERIAASRFGDQVGREVVTSAFVGRRPWNV
jgi:SAM-dependent methyltransferase